MMATIERILNSNILSIESVLSEKTDEIQYLLADRISKIKFDVLNNNQYKVDDTLVRPEILESWLRSKDFGVDPAKTIYGKFVDKNLINTIFKEKQYIVKAVQPFVYSLRRIVNNSNFIFFITDEKGFILYVYPGNELMAERAKQIKMEPGVLCSEEIIGTCAHTLALKLKNPIQVVGAEHFCDSFNERVCSSAPIFDGNKSLLGTVNITTLYSEGRSLYFLGSVISIAMAIENQINTNNLINTILEVSDGSFMILDSNGIVTDLNHKVIDLLEVPYTNIVGYHYKCVIGNQPYIQSVLENGESVSDVNIAIPRINKAIRLLSAQPVGDDNKKYGCILVLESLPELKSTMKEMDGEDLRFAFDKIVGNSAPMQKTREIAMKFSKNDVNILLLGESGTGKEVFAQAIHNQSRPRKPFVAINCSSIPQNLIESELFGYESGAFTGAERKGRKGKIELANEGTLFLDEIGDMPLELQAVFLRVLEDKKVMRIGGNRYIPIDFRLIAATNKNLKELVKLHKFREDLYYRLYENERVTF
jgi:transcriptional regulator of acetoin/glycerol metabolism